MATNVVVRTLTDWNADHSCQNQTNSGIERCFSIRLWRKNLSPGGDDEAVQLLAVVVPLLSEESMVADDMLVHLA